MWQERIALRNEGERMQTSLKTKIGPFLVISSVLAVWMFLAAQPVQAHTLTNPSCGGLPTADTFYTASETAGLAAAATISETVTPKQGTGASGGGSRTHHYAKITVPALTAGELTVSGGTNAPSEATLCRGSSSIASSIPSYATAHNNANAAADTAARAAVAARVTNASESTAKSALRNAASALRSAATALDNLATALTNAGNTSAAGDATSAAGTARSNADTAIAAADRTADTSATDEAGDLDTAAGHLDAAATALGVEMTFADFTAIISSGTEEYVLVVTIPADDADGAAAMTVSFKGVMATSADAQNGQDGGSFTQNNQRITHTLMTTSDPGLLTVGTTGSAVDTIGTLNQGATEIAKDEDSGGNFEIVSPVGPSTTYSLHVDGQTRGERGDYGLDMEFGVAVNLGSGADYADTAPDRASDTLERGRADYFFFTARDRRFLTVQTQQPTGVATETNTIGTLFSRQGLVTTDTNSGVGNNFRLSAPISLGDYIIEVKGASSSTEGEYALVATARVARSLGNAPDMIANDAVDPTPLSSSMGISAGREVDPHSIMVNTPGTLQVKTTGMTDTVGVLYGPDGQQIATDDNSGTGMNFLITEYVEAGLYLVTVEGQTATTTGAYTLVANFVEGATVDGPTTPGTGTETEQELRDQIADLQDDLTMCTPHVETDATGNLDDPNSVAPNNGYRSGVGLIRGWVCAANEVEVRIYDTTDTLVATVSTPHGSVRPDTAARCGGDSNTGFAAQYNYNHLAEGVYTAQVYADDQRVGEERTFEVVHLTEFSRTDTDRFLRDLPAGTCDVEDFPETGEATRLRWEESLQNFVVEDAG